MSDGKTSLNLELLIKLLKLTTSSNDGEALMASRKANEVLAKFGGDWEALLRGKVTVIADPFAAAAPPPPKHAPPPAAPKAPTPAAPITPRTHTPPTPRWAKQPRASASAAAQSPASVASQAAPAPAPTRNTLRKQRVQLDDIA